MTLFSPNTSMDLNNSYEQKVCGSLYDDPALGPAQGSPSLPIVFSTTLAALGAFGAVLNALVVIGVRGNAKLGTTVNKLLIYITCFAFLEAVYGILVRSLALGKQSYMRGKTQLLLLRIFSSSLVKHGVHPSARLSEKVPSNMLVRTMPRLRTNTTLYICAHYT